MTEPHGKINKFKESRRLMLAPKLKNEIISFDDSPSNQVAITSLRIIRISFTDSFEAHGLSVAVTFENHIRAMTLYFKNFSPLDLQHVHYLNDEPVEYKLKNVNMFISFLHSGKLKIDFSDAAEDGKINSVLSFQCDAVMDMSLTECREILLKGESK